MSATQALEAETRRGPVLAVVLLSLLMPGLGHIRLGSWQAGLLLVGTAQLIVVGLRAVPYLMAPTPKVLVSLAALVVAAGAVILSVAAHAAWLARRQLIEIDAVGPRVGTYVPLPLDVRVRQAGPELGAKEPTAGSTKQWLLAVCLIAAGIAAAVALPSKWRVATIHTAAMAPNLGPGDTVVVDLHRVGLAPRRGEVVLLRSRDNDQPFILRRVIGLQTDRVVLRRLALLLNGNRIIPNETAEVFDLDGVPRPVWQFVLPQTDPFGILPDVGSQMADEPRLILVPSGQVLVMRDDRISPISVAGSVTGLASIAEIQGVATTLLWKRDGKGFLRRL